MVPTNITCAHVERALADIRRDGVPVWRESRGYDLVVGRRRYPPKLVLGLANAYASGSVLKASEFSGGLETNRTLGGLGYRIVRAPKAEAPARSKGPRVATVILETDPGYETRDRVQALRVVVRELAAAVSGRIVVSFAGGWFNAGHRRPTTILDNLVRSARQELRRIDGRLALTFGIDGRHHADQLALALTVDGVVAMGRKFHAAPGEEENLDPAEDWALGEGGRSRVADLFGRRFFLAVCYDGFGIKHRRLPKPGVDAVIDHVHSFGRRGSGFGSGDVLFARHGLAGASQEWRVPVFAAVRFVDRQVPKDWPSGVMWSGAKGSTMKWTYGRNRLRPERVLAIETPAGNAVVRLFPQLQ